MGGKKRKLTPEQDEDISLLYRSGLPVKALCKGYGVTHVPIYASLRRTKTPLRGNRKIDTGSRVVALRDAGKTPEEIARLLGKNIKTVYWHLNRADRYASEAVVEKRDLIRRLAKKLPPPEIAEVLGISISNVKFYLGGESNEQS